MPLSFFGPDTVKRFYVGQDAVRRIYLGTELVWSNASPNIYLSPGEFTLDGFPIVVTRTATFNFNAADFNVTGFGLIVSHASNINLGSDDFSITGFQLALQYERTINLESHNFVVTGSDIDIVAGSATLWQPSDAAGLQIWLKADTGITTDVNGVTGWADQSGHGRNATNPNARYPQISTDYFGGATTVLFGIGGVADELRVASGMTGHCFMAIRPTAAYGPSGTPGSAVLAITSITASWRIGGSGSGLSSRVMWTWHGSSSFDGISTTQLASISATEHVVGIIWNGAQYDMYVDGSANLRDLTQGVGTNVMTGGVTIGSSSNAAVYQGAIAEIIVYTSIDSTLRAKIEGYLAHKYGFESVLPVDHVYKSAPPTV